MPDSLLPRRRFIAAAAACTLAAVTRRTAAQSPLRILVGSTPGSIPDLVARRIAEQLAREQRVVLVDNRAGAAGRLAINGLRSAPADGSTLLLAPGAIATMYPAIYAQPGYDPLNDLLPVSTAAELALALAVGAAAPASVTSLHTFVEWARASGSQPSVGSPGVGTPPHVLAELFARRAGISWTHVPYAGGPPALNDLLGGRVTATMLPEGLLRSHAASGALRLLASSGRERSPFTPDLPTFAEQGFTDVVLREWFGFFVPAGTPSARVNDMATEVRRACADASLATAFSALAISPHAGDPARMAERIAQESAIWQPLIRSAGITASS